MGELCGKWADGIASGKCATSSRLGICGVMFGVELVEGKDRPSQLPRPEDDNKGGSTVGLVCRLTKAITLDSGFCVLQGIVEVRKLGVFASALIKKRRYWPKRVDGDGIKTHMEDEEVGAADALPGSLDGVKFHIFCMKEPDYVMAVMSTYGTNRRTGKRTKRMGGERTEENVVIRVPRSGGESLPLQYRHAVDDHNSRRHSPICLEQVWGTKWWPNKVFCFLLAVTEVNCNLANAYFNTTKKMSQIDFRRELAAQLINNPYYDNTKEESPQTRKRRQQESGHELQRLPPSKTWQGSMMVDAKSQYPQRKCEGCHVKIRTYCICSPGVAGCAECYAVHVSREESTSEPANLFEA